MFPSDLPTEIQSRILELCSRSDLAALSRVHTSGQDMAEYALYSRIQYCARPSDLIIPSCSIANDEHDWFLQELKEDRSLLHTLANNSRKASMVKMFYVEFEDEFDDNHEFPFHYTCMRSTHFILVKLAEALVKMPNLVDLRILHGRMKDSDDFKGTRRISEVIRGNYFKLHTLYVEYYHHLEGIVADQPHLRLLGFHCDRDDMPKIHQRIHQDLSRCRTMPAIFTLNLDSATINMFPAFHHPGEALGVYREVASSLSNLSHGPFGNDYDLSVSLFGISEENISLLGELMEAMATCPPDHRPRGNEHFSVIVHEKSIHKPWRFPEFVKSLALFEDVDALHVVYPDINFDKWYQLARDLELCMVKNLGRAWPSLQEIVLFYYMTPDLLVMKRESNWKVIEGLPEPLEGEVESIASNFGDE